MTSDHETDGLNAEDEETFAAALDGLWASATVWPAARRDLLGLADAATRHVDMRTYTPEQRRAIYEVWGDIAKPSVDWARVDYHVGRFADLGIDILGPIRGGIQ